MGNESKIIEQIVRFSTSILFRVTADYVILMTLANYVETLADWVAKSKRTRLGYGTRKESLVKISQDFPSDLSFRSLT